MGEISTVLKYKIGDNVIYKNSGICCICDIKEMSFTSTDKKLYYVLSPVYAQGSHTYVPAELEDGMRDLICKEEVEKAALASEAIVPFVEGKTIRKVIVVPNKIVNIVAN